MALVDGSLDIGMLKSANPDTTAFSEVDSAGRPTPTGTSAVSHLHAIQVGTVIHVACLSYTIPAMGDRIFEWDYWTFDCSTDSWTISGGPEGNVYSPATSFTGGHINVMVRANDGDIALAGIGPHAVDMGSDYSTIYHSWWNGSTWSTPARVDAGTTAVTFSSGRLSNDDAATGDYALMWFGSPTLTIEGRMLEGASHTAGTVGTISTAGVSGLAETGPPIIYDDSGTKRGTLIYQAAGVAVNGARFDPTSSDPFASETAESDVTGADQPTNSMALHAYDPATDTRYVIYIEQTSDLVSYVASVNEGTYGSPVTHGSDLGVSHWLNAKGPFLGTSPVDESSKVIAIVYRNASTGTYWYDEISLGAGPTPPPLSALFRRPNVHIRM